eukprot:1875971-Prymnesium_polylepis.1
MAAQRTMVAAKGGGIAFPAARMPRREPAGSLQSLGKPWRRAHSAGVRHRTDVPSCRHQVCG